MAATKSPLVKEIASQGASLVTKHLEFLGPLWSVTDQDGRLNDLERLQHQELFFFVCFYQKLPETNGTFINLPPSKYSQFFRPNNVSESDMKKNIAKDEIDTHVHMFDPLLSISYRNLLESTSKAILDFIA